MEMVEVGGMWSEIGWMLSRDATPALSKLLVIDEALGKVSAGP